MDLLKHYETARRESTVYEDYGRTSFSPNQAICLAVDKKSADKRDSVYSLLELLKLRGMVELFPDYDKTAFDLALDFVHSSWATLSGKDVSTVMDNLCISLNDRDVQQILAGRRGHRDPPSEHVQQSRSRPPLWEAAVVELFWSLSFKEGLQEIGPSKYRLSRQINREPCLREVTAYAPKLSKQALLLHTPTLPTFGLIVLARGDFYEIVSRACVLDETPETIPQNLRPGWPNFSVFFDPEDYTLSSATCKVDNADSRIRDIVETPVCRYPNSSFARMIRD